MRGEGWELEKLLWGRRPERYLYRRKDMAAHWLRRGCRRSLTWKAESHSVLLAADGRDALQLQIVDMSEKGTVGGGSR
jgi:hypothetical protein